MTEQKEITGIFKYEQDSKRYHRYAVEAEGGIRGALYIPKDIGQFPDRIVLSKSSNDVED